MIWPAGMLGDPRHDRQSIAAIAYAVWLRRPFVISIVRFVAATAPRRAKSGKQAEIARHRTLPPGGAVGYASSRATTVTMDLIARRADADVPLSRILTRVRSLAIKGQR